MNYQFQKWSKKSFPLDNFHVKPSSIKSYLDTFQSDTTEKVRIRPLTPSPTP